MWGDSIARMSFDIDDELLKDLESLALESNSDVSELTLKFIREGLNNKKRADNMQEVTISEEILDGIKNRSKHLNCNPEKLVNSILYDYLMKVKDVSSVDVEKLEKSAVRDNPEGDGTLKKLRKLSNVGWD